MTPSKRKQQLEITLEIQASPAQVWQALTEANDLIRWFPPEGHAEARQGGEVVLSWGGPYRWDSRITVWEPNRRLQWTGTMACGDQAGSQPVPLTVDFYLDGAAGSTKLRLVHAGFDAEANWGDLFDGYSRGWNFELRSLKHYLENHLGRDRRSIALRRKVQPDATALVRRIIGPEATLFRGRLEGIHPGERYDFTSPSPGLPRLAGLVVLNDAPRQFAATLDQLNNALFRVEIEQAMSTAHVWIWVNSYGVAEDRLAELEKDWNQHLDKLANTAACA